MSVGHRHSYHHSAKLEQECKRLLESAPIKAYLARPFKADFTHQIPLTGGSSVDGKNYYLDPSVPQGLRRFVLWHERTEKAFRDVLKMKYDRAHNLATCAEKMLVESAGKSWDEYKKQIGKAVRQDEQEKHAKVPKDLDPGPYRESGESHLLF